ncbi:MAG: phage integrase SAM-like domain-containing protein, partial [Ignavibacteria bacterium]
MFLFKRKNGYYYIGMLENGKRVNVSTKKKSKSEANESFRTFKHKKKSRNIFLSDFKTEVLKYADSNLSKSSQWHYANCLKHLELNIGNKPLNMFSTRDFESYKQLRLNSVNPVSVNIEFRTLKAIFNLALKWNYIESNPLVNIKQLQIPERKKPFFT